MPTDNNKIIGEMLANSIAGEVSKPVNKFVGADVSMSDNKRGGVDLKVDGITRTLANERDLLRLSQTMTTKQPMLINGENIKTINGLEILGAGNIAIDTGMQFYKAEYDGTHITHDGVVLTYAQIVEKYNDPNYFIYIEHDGYIFIPSLPPLEGDEIIEFICTYVYSGDVVVSRIIINSEEQTKYEHINIAKASDISYSAIAERLYNNTTNLTDAQKLRIEAWLGLSENYLTYYNATPYQVNGDYVPAHKKFVETYVAEHGTGYDDTEIRAEIAKKVDDVQINGTSILDANKVANIPLGGYLQDGLFSVGGVPQNYGINYQVYDGHRFLSTIGATNAQIDARTNAYAPIVSNKLDYAVKCAMTDGKGAEWTDTEKANARARMGVGESGTTNTYISTDYANFSAFWNAIPVGCTFSLRSASSDRADALSKTLIPTNANYSVFGIKLHSAYGIAWAVGQHTENYYIANLASDNASFVWHKLT